MHQRSGSRLFSCESVWARAGEGEWLRVGAVVTKSDDVSNADAVAAQKKLISWSATQLFPALNAKKGQAPELGYVTLPQEVVAKALEVVEKVAE